MLQVALSALGRARAGELTFGSFDQLDLYHLLGKGLPAHDVKSHNTASFLQRLHGCAVGHFPHIRIIHKEDAIAYSAPRVGRDKTETIGLNSRRLRSLKASEQAVEPWQGLSYSYWSTQKPRPPDPVAQAKAAPGYMQVPR